jgi:hypothetical protein
MHGREQRVLNERLAEHGYPTRGIDDHVRDLCWWRDRFLSKKINLAFTAALEPPWPNSSSPTSAHAKRSAGQPPALSLRALRILAQYHPAGLPPEQQGYDTRTEPASPAQPLQRVELIG